MLKKLDPSIPNNELANKAKEILDPHFNNGKGIEIYVSIIMDDSSGLYYSEHKSIFIAAKPKYRSFELLSYNDIKKEYDTYDYDSDLYLENKYSTLIHELGHMAQDMMKILAKHYGVKSENVGISAPANRSDEKKFNPYGKSYKSNLEKEQIHSHRRIEYQTNALSDVEAYIRQKENGLDPIKFISNRHDVNTSQGKHAINHFIRLLNYRGEL